MIGDDEHPDEHQVPEQLGTRPGAVFWLTLAPGTPTVGLWCETCLLPSRYEVPVYVLLGDGPSRIGTANGCDGGCES